MDACNALIVDDEADIRELIEMTLLPLGVTCYPAQDLGEAHALLKHRPFGFCITDLRLPDGSGLDLVAHIQKHHPNLPVAVITAHGNVESAVDALKLGAFDFVSKPFELAVLRNIVATALRLSRGENQPDASRPILLGHSAAMENVRQMIAKLARSQAPILISGESGTGKEMAARLIHLSGPRADKPFVPVNCGAIPEHLMESEFFGYKKGSFTGAAQDKSGLFQAAQGGTLFLDEVADLPVPMQVKLLRAIQERAVRPVGAQTEVATDVRILSATHKKLAELVKQGVFRQDLVLPAECDRPAHAQSARAPAGYFGTGRGILERFRRAVRLTFAEADADRLGGTGRLRVSRQHPRVGEYPGASLHPVRGWGDPGRGPVATDEPTSIDPTRCCRPSAATAA